MISPRENHEEYQAALAWVGRQVEEAERQGLTLDYLCGVAALVLGSGARWQWRGAVGLQAGRS